MPLNLLAQVTGTTVPLSSTAPAGSLLGYMLKAEAAAASVMRARSLGQAFRL